MKLNQASTELVRELLRRRLLIGGARRAEARSAPPPRDAGDRSATPR
jgi:hypothetical protein